MIGLQEAKNLPVSLVLDGKTVFTGFDNMEPTATEPSLAPGQGVHFEGGTPNQQQQVRDLLLEHKEAIYEWTGKLGMFRNHVVDLPLRESTPVAAKPYAVGPDKREAFRDILQKYLQQGFIEPSSSLWGSPAFLVPKKVAPGQPPKWRLVEDYREVNKKLQDLPAPVPSVQQLLDDVGPNASYYAVLDMTSGYHHCPLAAEARPITAFITPEGVFQYRVLPFGLKVAPQLFQHALQQILKDQLHRACLVYLDDVIVFGDTFEQFMANLKEVVQALTSAGGCLGISKCRFLATEIEYLGRRISRGSTRPSETSIQAVLEFPQPTTKVGLQRFLGLATYVRQYVDHFADLEHKIRSAIPADPKKNATLQWTSEATEAFQQIKELIANYEALAVFDPKAKHLVLADASASAIGAVLLQQEKDDQWRPVAYASRVLTSPETRYSNTDRELLSVTWAVAIKFRSYLEGRRFVIGTDHKALIGTVKLRPETARTVRLLLRLAPFSYEIRHVPGREMQVADALSRASQSSEPGTERYSSLQQTSDSSAKPGMPPCLAQTGGTHRLESVQFSNSDEQSTNSSTIKAQGTLPVVATTSAVPLQPMSPTELKQLILDVHATHCHANWKKTYYHVKERVSCPGLRQTVWRTVLGCPHCITYNPPSGHVQSAMESIESAAINEVMVVDILGPIDPPSKGRRYALLTVDHFSRFATIHPISRPTVRCVTKALSETFKQLGKPSLLVSDPGAQFKSKEFKQFLAQHKIRQHLGSAAAFRATSTVERLARTLKMVAAKLQDSHPTVSLLQTAIKQYNSTIHGSTQRTPEGVFFDGQHPVRQNQATVQRHNWRRRKFKAGDLVLRFVPRPSNQRHSSDRHLQPRAQGPFHIIEEYPFNRFLVTDGYTQKLFPASSLRLFPVTTSFSRGESNR